MQNNPFNYVFDGSGNMVSAPMFDRIEETSVTQQQPSMPGCSWNSAELENGVPTRSEIKVTKNVPNFNILVHKIVCKFHCGCKLDLSEIAQNGFNVELLHNFNILIMQLRKPKSSALIFSSGSALVYDLEDQAMAKMACRRYARMIQKINPNVTFKDFGIVNAHASCNMPWNIDTNKFAQKYTQDAILKSDINSCVSYKCKHLKSNLKIFATGRIEVHAPNVAGAKASVKFIYPQVFEFRKERASNEETRVTSE